jgi:Fe-S-cluster containining protein
MRKLPLWVEKEGGLAFSCTRCGECCRGGPGFVWVGEGEIGAIARFLGMDRDSFGRRYLRRVGARLALVEKPNWDCVFWEEARGCTVYDARPAQCRTYPFWPEVVRSRASWRAEKARCPGIAQGGRRYLPEEIARLLSKEGET